MLMGCGYPLSHTQMGGQSAFTWSRSPNGQQEICMLWKADGDTQIEMVCCESDPLFHVHILHVLLQLFAEVLHTCNFQSPLHSLMYNFHFLLHLHNCVSNH